MGRYRNLSKKTGLDFKFAIFHLNYFLENYYKTNQIQNYYKKNNKQKEKKTTRN
ncbi:hypothetical protein [Candidatus Phytoplasma ziziphi]|uniref:hypothetical protein n=1 Tax=Ziziphus jujuba witches'-broom phytoplasma TaxID=135727 RepID=UPI001EE00F12|nr:hypothetical protein [Candidatus Phytoplasma ziziphi]